MLEDALLSISIRKSQAVLPANPAVTARAVATVMWAWALLPFDHLLPASHEAEVPRRLTMANAAARIPLHVCLGMVPIVFICVTILRLRSVHAVYNMVSLVWGLSESSFSLTETQAIEVLSGLLDCRIDNILELTLAVPATTRITMWSLGVGEVPKLRKNLMD